MNIREEQQKKRALQQLEQSAQISTQTDPDTEVLNIAVRNEVNKIRAMQTNSARLEYKKSQFLPKFLPLAEQRQGKRYHHDLLFGFCLIYLCDVGDFEKAIPFCLQGVDSGRTLAPEFHRTPETFLADSLLSWAEQEHRAGRSAEPYFSRVFELILNEKINVHEIVQAKYFKQVAQALTLNKLGEPHPASVQEIERVEQAFVLATLAEARHRKIQIKSFIARCAMRISALNKSKLHQRGDESGNDITLNADLIIRLLNAPRSLKE